MYKPEAYDAEVRAGREEIASMLNDVAEGIRTGSVQLGEGPDAVTVDTPEELSLEIELETESEETSLELELEWPALVEPATGSVAETSTDTAEDSTPVAPSEEVLSLAAFEVYQASDEAWHWRLRHDNGNIIATGGQGYTRKHNALKGLRSVMANSGDAAVTGSFSV